MKIKFKKDTEFVFRDYLDKFDHSKVIVKKDTIIDVNDFEYELYDGKLLFTLFPSEYDENNVKVEIIKESENDINDVNELRQSYCFVHVNTDDIDIVEK